MTLLPTYSLTWSGDWSGLQGKTHFYWMSGSLFEQALRHVPGLREAEHFCNPGNTYDALCHHLGSSKRVHLRLGYQQWLEEMKK